ncbi:MAG: polyphosphate polymerase domain-containing protein [Muribaculaceae bacterium]|nr:polyphosphate polymerase domain-containing protein [Muribaculaceae bacterium]
MSVLDRFSTISLEEMKQVKLMNRTDTKFVATEDQLHRLLELASEAYLLQMIDGEVLMPYYTRYYDTEDCAMYCRHHNGKLTRNKVRVRRYEGSGLEFIEVKRKNNKGRTDKRRITAGEHLDDNSRANFLREASGYEAHTLRPQIENRFYRLTLVNKNKTERLTIDTRLRCVNLVAGADCDLTGLGIIELKRDGRVASPIAGMLKQLRIKQSGFSKYCIGMALTNPTLPTNRFKPRLRMIKKMLSV